MGRRVVIGEDHPLMVEAVRLALEAGDEFELVGVAATGPEILELAKRAEPEIVLVDLRLPGLDGIEVLQALRRAGSPARRVVLSADDDPDAVALALDAGACAFISKRIDPADLGAALRQAVDQTVFQPLGVNPLLAAGRPGESGLTARELSVLDGVADGLSNREIARKLSYAEQTVKLDLTHVYRKLGVSSRTEAVAVGLRRGLIESEPGSLLAATSA